MNVRLLITMLLLFYLATTLFVAGFMLVDEMIWGGITLLIGSFLGFAGGSGMQASFDLGRTKGGMIVGAIFALAGMSLVFYFDVVLRIFGSTISADLWVLLGFGFGFLSARPEDAGVQTTQKGSEDDVALGVIAPIAAEVAVGRLTPQQAEKHIKESEFIAPGALALWQSMSAKEREELGLNFMRLAVNPEFAARIEEQLAPLQEADPELWEQSLAKAREQLGRSPNG